MPVLDAGRAPEHVAGLDLLDRAAPLRGAAFAGGDDQALPERMGVPGRASSGLKGDIGAGLARGFIGGEHMGDGDFAGKVGVGAWNRGLRASTGDGLRWCMRSRVSESEGQA